MTSTTKVNGLVMREVAVTSLMCWILAWQLAKMKPTDWPYSIGQLQVSE